MYYPIDEIDGLSDRLSAALSSAQIKTTRDLLERAGADAHRPALVRSLSVSQAELERAVQIADLLRVRDVAGKYAARLHDVGITSVAALAKCDAEELLARLAAAKKAARTRSPNLDQVQGWIADARTLKPAQT